jgi:hypothetical protein
VKVMSESKQTPDPKDTAQRCTTCYAAAERALARSRKLC